MSGSKALRAIGVGACVAVGLSAPVDRASAATTTLCVKDGANGAVKGPTVVGGNTCKPGYNVVTLPGAAELAVLEKILPHMNYVESGVAGKPTIQFSGVNVQVVNGEGKTASLNGEGNFVIGYDENAGRTQTGSHNLILGEEQAFSSFGGIAAGYGNTISGREASVSGGFLNTASGFYTSITGGTNNTASVEAASVSGGVQNTAGSQGASVQGGNKNVAEARDASIFGGKELVAKNEYEAIP
jgi:hypothetical protein